MRRFLVALMLACSVTSAHAVGMNEDAPVIKCVSPAQVQRDVSTWPYVAIIVRMSELDTRNFLATYNAEEPVSNYTAETSFAIMPTNVPVVIWVPFKDGCALATLTFSKSYFMKILKTGDI
jgi:hypothetical protein